MRAALWLRLSQPEVINVDFGFQIIKMPIGKLAGKIKKDFNIYEIQIRLSSAPCHLSLPRGPWTVPLLTGGAINHENTRHFHFSLLLYNLQTSERVHSEFQTILSYS